MNIIAFLLVGIFVGWIASLLLDGQGLGVLGDMVVGVIGAFVGGFLFNLFGISTYGFWSSLSMAIVGAMVFLFLVRLVSGHSSSRRGHNLKL